MYWLKSQTTSHGDFMHVFLGCLLFANTAGIKIITKHVITKRSNIISSRQGILQAKWVQAVKHYQSNWDSPSSSSVLCSKHFEQDCCIMEAMRFLQINWYFSKDFIIIQLFCDPVILWLIHIAKLHNENKFAFCTSNWLPLYV